MPGGKRTERISERDLEVLSFVARFGRVPRGAVAVWADTRRSVTLAREKRLREADLVELHPPIDPSGPFLICTRRGLRRCGCRDLSVAEYTLNRITQSSAVAHVAAALERSGERLYSQREMAAVERAAGEPIYSTEFTRRRPRRPDLIRLGPSTDAIVVQIAEFIPKRFDDLLREWRHMLILRRFARVIYLCSPRALRYVRRRAERVRIAIGEDFLILPLSLPDLDLPGPARQPSGGLGAAVKGLRPDPLRGLTAAPPPLPSQVGPGVEGQSAR
jgi:hypothetical protein